jgi:hypothetical protein
VTFGPSGHKLFVNGELLASSASTASFSLLGPGGTAYIGANSHPNDGGLWNGLIDEMAVFGRALSAGEVASIADAGSGGKCSLRSAPLISSAPPAVVNSLEATVVFTDPEGVTTFMCAIDGGSYGPCASPATYSGLANGVHEWRAISEHEGNPSEAARIAWLVDTVGPSISCGGAALAWSATDASISCTATDGLSGLANSGDAAFTLGTSVPIDTESASVETNSRSVCDVAGNCRIAGPIGGNMIDKRAPSIGLVSPQDGQSYTLGWTVYADYSCADSGSGVSTCVGSVQPGQSIDTSSEGLKAFTVDARDAVGNVSQKTVTYNVIKSADRSGSADLKVAVTSFKEIPADVFYSTAVPVTNLTPSSGTTSTVSNAKVRVSLPAGTIFSRAWKVAQGVTTPLAYSGTGPLEVELGPVAFGDPDPPRVAVEVKVPSGTPLGTALVYRAELLGTVGTLPDPKPENNTATWTTVVGRKVK